MGGDYRNWDWRKSVARQLDPLYDSNRVRIHLNIHCHRIMTSLGSYVVFENVKDNTFLRFSKNASLEKTMVPYFYQHKTIGQLCISLQEFETFGLDRRTRYTLEPAGKLKKVFYLKPHSTVHDMTPVRLPVPAISIY